MTKLEKLEAKHERELTAFYERRTAAEESLASKHEARIADQEKRHEAELAQLESRIEQDRDALSDKWDDEELKLYDRHAAELEAL